MVRLAAHDALEIICIYRPLGVPLGERTLRGIRIICRDGVESELHNITPDANKLTMFLVKPQTLLDNADVINKLSDKKITHNGTIGFLLVEAPDDICTVRKRKWIQSNLLSKLVVGDLRAPYTFAQLVNEINKATLHLFLMANQDIFSSVLAIRDIEAKSINEIGSAMVNGQASIDQLLRLILEKTIDLSIADAGFLLLKENIFETPDGDETKIKRLRQTGTKFMQKSRICKSQNIKLGSAILDPQTSAFTSVVVNRSSVFSWEQGMDKPQFHSTDDFTLPEMDVPFPELDFDKRSYIIKSYCVFPLRTPSCDVVGFIILLNRRISSEHFCDSIAEIEENVTEFNNHDLNILGALANQAGVSIDHARLYRDLRNLFESFVQASVVAIESRDPTTKGHSERVAVMTVALAEAVTRVDNGPYGNIVFNPSQLYELKYAALLHDFGKIGVQEAVLRKEKKLYPFELSEISERLNTTAKQLHLSVLEAYIEGLMKRSEIPTAESYARVKMELAKISREFSEFWESICDANEPNIIHQNAFEKISKIAALKISVNDSEIELLTRKEIERLSIRKGSLSPEERIEIESHVSHSYRFLIQIPWSNDLINIPDIVHAHHERLDGSGYPRGLVDTRDEIPIQAKIMAITDIYDALVAMDRPYKKAIPQQRALSILEAEVKDGKLDKHLFDIFIQANIIDLVKYSDSAA